MKKLSVSARDGAPPSSTAAARRTVVLSTVIAPVYGVLSSVGAEPSIV